MVRDLLCAWPLMSSPVNEINSTDINTLIYIMFAQRLGVSLLSYVLSAICTMILLLGKNGVDMHCHL